jgi:hypothetical protein
MPVGGLAVADPGGGSNGLERALEEQVLPVGEVQPAPVWSLAVPGR